MYRKTRKINFGNKSGYIIDEFKIKLMLVNFLFDSIKLEYFYPKMTPGGVIIIHDCNNEFTGSKRALNEFFLNKPETPIIIPDKSGSAIVVKL